MSADDPRSSAAVAHEAEDARANLAHTLDQLRDNLKPEHVLEEVVSNARIGANTLAESLYRIARENPVPAFLISVGAAIILGVGARTQVRFRSSTEPVQSTRSLTSRPGATSLGRTKRPYESLGSMDRPAGIAPAAATSERVWDSMNAKKSAASRRLPPPSEPSRLSGILDEQPLIIAALGVAVGAALGAALPTTRTEDAWVGGASSSVRGAAHDMAKGEIDDLADVVGRTARQVQQTAMDRGMSSENVSGFVKDVGEQTKSAIHDLGTHLAPEKQAG